MSNLRFLKTFLAVAHTGSFTGAADIIALTVPAVSQQMRALESELNRKLFERDGRNLRITPDAQRLIPRISALVEEYEALRSRPSTRELSGSVTIGVIISALALVSQALLPLESEYPGLEVRLEGFRSAEIADGIKSGRLSAGIVVLTPEIKAETGLHCLPLYREPLRLIVSADRADSHSAVADLIRNNRFIRYDRSSPTGSKIDSIFQKFQSRSPSSLELNSLPSIVELVRQNLGVAIIPLLKGFNLENDPSLFVTPVSDENVHRSVGLLRKSSDCAASELVCRRILATLRDAA